MQFSDPYDQNYTYYLFPDPTINKRKKNNSKFLICTELAFLAKKLTKNKSSSYDK